MKPNLIISSLRHGVSRKHPQYTGMLCIQQPPKTVNTARVPLNVVFVIDVSGSMSSSLGEQGHSITTPGHWEQRPIQPVFRHPVVPQPGQPWGNPMMMGHAQPAMPDIAHPVQQPQMGYEWVYVNGTVQYTNKSKLELVKDATVVAIDMLDERDCVGVVAFDGTANIVFKSTTATNEAKNACKKAVQALRTGGSTALHAGWKLGAEMVCQHLNPAHSNRVLLLTDGEATDGIRDAKTLGRHVAAMVEHHVSTSTFGVGVNFNEDLLQHMSDEGDGRYYYLENAEIVTSVFVEEFQGLSQLFGKKARLQIVSSFGNVEVLNGFDTDNEWHKLPNLLRGKNENIVFKVNATLPKGVKHIEAQVTYTWVSLDGVAQSLTASVEVPVITEKAYGLLVEDADVGEKVLEMEVATAKRKAMAALDAGDMLGTRTILESSKSMIAGSAYANSMSLHSDRLDTMLCASASGSTGALRKMASIDAYSTRDSYDAHMKAPKAPKKP